MITGVGWSVISIVYVFIIILVSYIHNVVVILLMW